MHFLGGRVVSKLKWEFSSLSIYSAIRGSPGCLSLVARLRGDFNGSLAALGISNCNTKKETGKNDVNISNEARARGGLRTAPLAPQACASSSLVFQRGPWKEERQALAEVCRALGRVADLPIASTVSLSLTAVGLSPYLMQQAPRGEKRGGGGNDLFLHDASLLPETPVSGCFFSGTV